MERRRMDTKRLRAWVTAPNVVLCCMLALFWMFLWVTFQSPTNLPLAPFDGAPAVPARFVSLSAMALGGAVLLVRARRGARKTDRSARVALYGACVAAAALLVALDVAGRRVRWGLRRRAVPCGVRAVGLAGGAGVHRVRQDCSARWGAARFRFCVACCIVSVVLSLPLHLAAWYLHGEFRETMVLLFLVSFCPVLDYLRRAFALKDSAPDRETRVPVKFVLTLLVLGLALGMMQGLFTAFTAAVPERSDLKPALVAGTCGGQRAVPGHGVRCANGISIGLSIRWDFRSWRWGFWWWPWAAARFSAFCSRWRVTSSPSCACGYSASTWPCRFAGWGAGCSRFCAARRRSRRRWAWAWPTGGGVVGFQREVCVVVGAALLAFSLYSVTSKNPYESWGIMRPGESDEANVLEQACDLIAVEEFFTPREKDVFLLLAQGHNRLAVSQRLVVSENTVKTHMSNIYQKLGVHAQQELIDVVEARCKELRERGKKLEF